MRATAWKSAALAAAVAVCATASADGDDHGYGYKKDWYGPKGQRDYMACLKTPAAEFPGTIVDAALATPDLKTLADAVVAAGLVDTLNGKGPFTVYAPTNDAFGKIPASVLGAITSDVTLLTAVLTYHVTPGQGPYLDPRLTFRGAREVPTVQGQTVFFNRSGSSPQINQSNVNCQAVKTTNGTVWLIDSVLLPQF